MNDEITNKKKREEALDGLSTRETATKTGAQIEVNGRWWWWEGSSGGARKSQGPRERPTLGALGVSPGPNPVLSIVSGVVSAGGPMGAGEQVVKNG